MTPEQQLGRIYRTYSPPWVLWRSPGILGAGLRVPGVVWLVYAKTPDELGRRLREADLHRPATRAVYRRALLTAGKNRVHVDLTTGADDRDQEIERLLSLGARRVDIGQTGAGSWTVLADPEGNEFCVVRPKQTLTG
jgi:Glyoxalase-like domain